VNAIKDRKIDAFFWSGGVPDGGRHRSCRHARPQDEADRSRRVRRRDEQALRAALCEGGHSAGSYPGQDKPNAEIDVWNILIASDKMSDQMAYDIVKTLFEKKPDLVAVHAEAKNIDLKNQAQGSPIPFHPGAKKYLAEQGIKVN
jgi:TRAP transporter TAXI family solute receptor